jgi:DNA invertase Pin-like site-specific DNA recombinase
MGVGFRSVCDGAIDTTTPSGELIFHVFSALAQFERRLIGQRTKDALAERRLRGDGSLQPVGELMPDFEPLIQQKFAEALVDRALKLVSLSPAAKAQPSSGETALIAYGAREPRLIQFARKFDW